MPKLPYHFLIFLLIVSCSSSLPKQDNAPNVAGAAVGGAVGVAGTAVLGAPRPLVIGAGLGGIALGYYMTTLRFDAGPIYKVGGEVYTQGEYTTIIIPAYKLFEPNSSTLLPQGQYLLDSAIAVIKRYPNSNIFISGNTSGIGTSAFNQKLSTERAKEVASYLWAHGINNFKNQSINSRQLSFAGYGSSAPIADNSRISNAQKNNRIQITIYPSKSDLKIDKGSTTFGNIGGISDDPLGKG